METDGDAEHRAYVEAWERAHPGQPFPQPWRTPEDARGWRTVARGRKWPARPDAAVELEVVLPPDDYVWLARRSIKAGMRPSEYLAQLVAEACSQDDHDPAVHSG